ncbi:MAG: polysaccharide biosynthesis protein [Betaproteobacteria bacterium]|nr:MAG: polysaccharide biosynthesis protein [Betaproteobacteria bacterium]
MIPRIGKPSTRSILAFIHDLVAAFVAWGVAFLLRFNFEMPADFQSTFYMTVGWVVLIDGATFLSFRLYRGLWRYASLHDLRNLLAAVGFVALAIPTAMVLIYPGIIVPRSVYVLHPLLLAAIMGGSRLAYRGWKDRNIGRIGAFDGKPVLILGAGDAAIMLLRELARSTEWRVVGLLDDDPAKAGRQILGAVVLGRTDALEEMAHRFGVSNAIIAMPSTSHQVRKRLVELCQAADVRPLTVPSFEDLMGGKVAVSQIRQVELDDLLGRDPVKLDNAGLHRFFDDRTVLVTGAGGSIGSELCRQIAKFAPSRLVLFEQSEFNLYQMEQEFHEVYPGVPVTFIMGDVKNQERVDAVFKRFRPELVFHAAAYKHVPLMESGNAWETVRNNVLGTRVVASAAVRYGADKFVMVSTDKAVNPTNVMGASKRLAEIVCQRMQGSGSTRFVVVRFGNVLGSTGSVIPKFRKQIEAGGPITVTHPDVTRYFMSIPEAAQLVLQAGLMGQGGEIFVLDMGEPVRIIDLARDMVRLSGLTEEDIDIEFVGLRAGEKLFEELLCDGETTMATPHPKLRIAKSRPVSSECDGQLDAWLDSPDDKSDEAVREILRARVPEYSVG